VSKTREEQSSVEGVEGRVPTAFARLPGAYHVRRIVQTVELFRALHNIRSSLSVERRRGLYEDFLFEGKKIQ